MVVVPDLPVAGSIIAMHNVGLVISYLNRFLLNERQSLPDAGWDKWGFTVTSPL